MPRDPRRALAHAIGAFLALPLVLAGAGCPTEPPDDYGSSTPTPSPSVSAQWAPLELDFGTVEPLSEATRALSVASTGSGTLRIDSVEIAAPFSLATTLPLDIPAASSAFLDLVFSPTADGDYSGSAVFLSNAGDDALVSIQLHGIAATEVIPDEICDNSLDDDGDGDPDCADSDCDTFPACIPEDCDEEGDEDGDGKADCEDDDCA